MRSSGLTSKVTKQKVISIVVVDCSTEKYVLTVCFKAKIMSEVKIEKTILWQLDSCKRKQPILEKIARELLGEVEYIRTFAEKREKIQSTHEGSQAYLHHTLQAA